MATTVIKCSCGRIQDTIMLFTFFLIFSSMLAIPMSQSEGRDHGVHCSRSRSRTAWKIVDEYLLPFVEEENFNLSTTCRLHPENDMFREQEKEKDELRPHHWQCRYCRKVFRSEEYLDKHFNNRHSAMLNMSRQNCLADVCGAIHCDYMDSKHKKQYAHRKCNPSVSRRNQHLCENLANSCFPPKESAVSSRLHDFFLRQFCDAHSCKQAQKIFPRGNGRTGGKALYYVLTTLTFCLLIMFYGAVYAYRRDTNLTTRTLKRLSQHDIYKSQRSKQH
ncbi:hypothetical protein O6H91_11G076000 [Diphasiastrum complanatum]|nr:hypothetical protein O6H91_11G076000 [Diphasiastrum complanatum]